MKNAIALWMLTRDSLLEREKERDGVKEMLPLGCLPLVGREGVTLIAFLKDWSVPDFLQSQKIITRIITLKVKGYPY